MNKEKNKLYIVRTYVMAKNARQALSKAKKTNEHECWVDDDWAKGNRETLANAVGFTIERND